MSDYKRRISEDFKSDDTDKRTQSEKMHDHWRAVTGENFRKELVETPITDGPTLIATEADTDKALGYHYHDMQKSGNTKNFDQKIYMFPPAFNALRREIHDNWPALWEVVSWRMANRPEEFCAMMNSATDLRIIFDSGAVNWMCDKWLNKLIKLRMDAAK